MNDFNERLHQEKVRIELSGSPGEIFGHSVMPFELPSAGVFDYDLTC